MSIIDYVKAHVNPDEYYKKRFPKWDTRSRPNVNCPWHDDSKPSLSIGLRNGGARCHTIGCEERLGSIVHFESKLKKIPESLAARRLYAEFVRPVISQKVICKFANNLQYDPRWLHSLQVDTGITPRTAKRFSLGLDYVSKRIIIPIQNQFGLYTNLRYYKLPSHRKETTSAKIYNEKGYGYAELFPWQCIKEYTPDEPIYWMKAERDVILAIMLGLQAVCVVGGEGNHIQPWVHHFKDFNILIIPDNDEPGILGARRKLQELTGSCKLAKIVTLDFKGKSGKDYSDWVLQGCGTTPYVLDDRTSASDKTRNSKESIRSKDNGSNGSHRLVPISTLKDNHQYKDQRVKARGIITGKLDRTYTIPYKFRIQPKDGIAETWSCPFGRELAWMIRESDDSIAKFVRYITKNPKAKVTPIEFITASEVEISPVVDFNSRETYSTFKAIYLGKEPDTNVPSEFEIIPTTSIKTQEQIGIILKEEPLTALLDRIEITPNEIEELQTTFSPEGDDAWEQLCNFANEISLQYTRIYNRLDWHIAALLTWLSPLYFNYGNDGIQRGWLNTLALGDTRTGKSEVAMRLQKLFGCGTFVDAENCTFVGLVGGTVKNASGQFMLRWGRVPTNDRQLVVIEELSGLSVGDISRMSSVRSSGIARIDKGGITAEVSARTRLLALSNVRGMGRSLVSYQSGVRAILELIGAAEDVSRFDLICTLTDSEVSSTVINSPAPSFREAGDYTEEALQKLVRFVWSLGADDINFTHEAFLASLQTTERMAKRYHPSIPLFKASDGRIKLARLATAIACALFSYDAKTDKIMVQAEHIVCAEKLLCMIYDKPSLGYLKFSQAAFGKDQIQNEDKLLHVIGTVLSNRDRIYRVVHFLETNGRFTDRELSAVGNIHDRDSNRLIGAFLDSNIIERGSQGYWYITPVGRNWLDRNTKK